MNVLGYCRVSTTEQKDNFSLQNQKQAIIDFCKSQNWQIASIYEDCDSGSNLDRKGFKELVSKIDANGFDGIVVWKLDRLSRSVVDGKTFIKGIEDKGKFIKSVTESFIH